MHPNASIACMQMHADVCACTAPKQCKVDTYILNSNARPSLRQPWLGEQIHHGMSELYIPDRLSRNSKSRPCRCTMPCISLISQRDQRCLQTSCFDGELTTRMLHELVIGVFLHDYWYTFLRSPPEVYTSSDSSRKEGRKSRYPWQPTGLNGWKSFCSSSARHTIKAGNDVPADHGVPTQA